MQYLSIIRTTSDQYKTFPYETGTVYICTDNYKVYLDRLDNKTNRHRVNITPSVSICETKDELIHLVNYRTDRLYICLNIEEFYISEDSTSITRVFEYDDIKDIVMQDPKTLIPKALYQDGFNIAPKTTTNAIFNANGENMAETFETLRHDVKHFNKVYTHTVTCPSQGQTIFTIPYPTYDYDIYTDNMIVVVNDIYYTPDMYDINDTKIVFKEGIPFDAKIVFIFQYHVVKSNNDVVDKSVGLDSLKPELLDLVLKTSDISNINFEDGTNLKQKLDEILNSLKGEDDNSGITSAIENIKTIIDTIKTFNEQHDVFVKYNFNSQNTKLDEILQVSNDILNHLKSNNTSITVKRIQRGTAILELNTELTEIMLDHEIIPEKSSVKLNGDSYYNESPYVYDVRSDRIIVRQKTPNVNPNYNTPFSWEVIEYY